MAELRFFRWHVDTRIVYGIRRAAIYDFRTGAVYSLNSAAAEITRLIDAGIPVGEISPRQRPFVECLRGLNLGEWADAPADTPQEPPATRQHPLTFLWLELTGGCNLGCVHCYAESQNPLLFPHTIPRPEGPSMTFEDWRSVLRQAAQIDCRRVQFIGGEVLLYPRLLQLIDAARVDGHTFIEVYTNGTLLTEHKVEALASRGVHVAVSLHGTEAATHDAVTGLRGSFERTVAGLRRLRESGIPVRIAGVAVRSNQHDIQNLAEIASGLNITEVGFDIVRGVGSGQNPDLIPDEPSVLSQKWLTWPNFVADRNEYEHNRHWNPCWAGKLAITYTGDVMPCVMGRTQVVGNVRQQSLAAMLASPRLLDLWGLTKDQVAVCQHCEYRYVCGDCRPLAASGGDLHGAIPRCTYNPRLGDWGRPGISARRPGPASEGPEPEIALSVGVAEEAAFLSVTERGAFSRFRCEPDNAPPLASRYGPLHRRNHHFRCEPDR